MYLYLWKQRSVLEIYKTDLAQQILDEPKDLGLGIRGLYFQEEGFRNFFMVKEVNGIEDLKGKKIRVSNDPILTGVVEQLGANPTVISLTNCIQAFSQVL